MKKKVKTMLAMLLAVALFTAMLPLCASAAETLYEGDFGAEGNNLHWKLDDQGTLTISGKGAMSDPYTAVESWPWFEHKDEITSVVVENGITDIGPGAFYSCNNINQVSLPNTITTIAAKAFENSASLSSIDIPGSVTIIGADAFGACGLSSVTIPDSVKSIGSGAFYSCPFTTINIPSSVESIGSGAFSGCVSLKEVDMPDNSNSNLKTLGSGIFRACTSLVELTIPDTVEYYDPTQDPFPMAGTDPMFEGCTSLETVSLSKGMPVIGDYFFSGCTSLKSIDIPESVKLIGDDAFAGCTSMTNINLPTSVSIIESSAFAGCTSLKNVSIPEDVWTISTSTFFGCTSLESVNIPEGVGVIDGSAFGNCNALKSITIPNSVYLIGNQAYGYASNYWLGTVEKIAGTEIRGYTGSEAERYAKDNEIKFVPIGDAGTAPTPTPVPTAAPTATPTAKPSVTPLPTQRPSDYPDVPFIPSPTSGPSYVPDPNHYPWQDTTPESTATPEPTATPAPSAEPGPTAAPSVPEFTDVKADVWYAEPVKWAAEHNITSGYPDGGFHPDDTCTRAHIVTFLWKVAGAPSVEGDIGFSDVSKDSYYYQAALWAEQSGITSGVGDGLFGSDNSCTREQVVTMLYKAAGSPAVSGDSPFGDLEQGSYYYNAAIWAQQNGIVAGYPDGGFHPSDPCTRAQIMTMLYNYAGK